MRVYDIKDKQGRVFAFEVDNTFLGRRGLRKLVQTIPGAQVVGDLRGDEFCAFKLGDVTFVAFEPFGDNSRYWVGPKPPRWVPEIEAVLNRFRRARIFCGFVAR